MDSNENIIALKEGLAVFIYEYNHYENGEEEYLLAEGFVELNDPSVNGNWTREAKWCCRLNSNGIVHK